MLQIVDLFFTILHIAVIGFNLLGWIWEGTRSLHFYCIILTATSWFILGVWYGFGYCFITDLQWQVKEKLGEENLPNSFIKYFADKMSGENINACLIDTLTLVLFCFAVIASVYVNFLKKQAVAN